MPAAFWSDFVAWAEPFVERHQALLWWVAIVSAAVAVVSLLTLPLLVSLIPDDYFATKERPEHPVEDRHPALYWLLRIGKNVLGLVLVLFGLVMSIPLVPGQGTIMALVGLLLVEFPGKRRLEMWIIRKRHVLKAINWLRARRGRPPLTVWTPDGPRRLPASTVGPREPAPR